MLYPFPYIPSFSQLKNKFEISSVLKGTKHQHKSYHALDDFLTLADDLWLGSSRGFRAPTPRVGSCVWKTDIRPPVGDISLKAAWRAGPKALWVSRVLVNICGKVFSKSWTSLWNKARKLKSVTIKKIFFHVKSLTHTIDKTLSHDDGQRIYRQYSKQWSWSNDKKAILSQHYKLASKTNQNWGLTVLAHAVVQQDYKSKCIQKNHHSLEILHI